MFKNKILFFSKRCDYNDNKILTSKNLSFLSTISFIVITRSLKSIVENNSNENSFDMNYSKNVSNKKRLKLTLKAFKKKRFKNLILSTLSKITR